MLQCRKTHFVVTDLVPPSTSVVPKLARAAYLNQSSDYVLVALSISQWSLINEVLFRSTPKRIAYYPRGVVYPTFPSAPLSSVCLSQTPTPQSTSTEKTRGTSSSTAPSSITCSVTTGNRSTRWRHAFRNCRGFTDALDKQNGRWTPGARTDRPLFSGLRACLARNWCLRASDRRRVPAVLPFPCLARKWCCFLMVKQNATRENENAFAFVYDVFFNLN